MIFNLPWIPDFSYFEDKLENPLNLDKALDFIRQKISKGEIFQSNTTLFWTLVLLYQMDKLNLIDRESIKKHILSLKHQDGGYKYSNNFKEPDTWNTFYCVAILKLLGLDKLVEDKDIDFIISSQSLGSGRDGGFVHCQYETCHTNCNGKTSIKSSFFALSTLALLDKLNKINKEQLLNYLKKDNLDDVELIYQILSLKILNVLETINLEKKIKIIFLWQISKSGFGINSNFPSIEHSYWAGICLGLLHKFELIDFEGLFDFLRTMQQDNGGFTDQYTSISSLEPNIESTAQGLICIFYVWNKLIEEIENEILYLAKDSSDIYFVSILKKFSISSKLIQNIANWLISKKWIDGKILDKGDIFQKYFDQQPIISQEIISKIMETIRSNQKQKKIDLNEFSKSFDFSNALERVRIVINDLTINNFLIGNIRLSKKRYILENFSIPEKYIHLLKPIPYVQIMDEKKRMEEARYKLLTLHTKLNEYFLNVSESIQSMIDQEKISEANEKLNESIEFVGIQIRKFEGLINQINSSHKFVDFKLLNIKFEKIWPIIKTSIEESLSNVKSKLEEKIQKKEEFISQRVEKAKDQENIKMLEELLIENSKKLDQNQVEIKNFFLKNFTNHKAIKKKIKTISDDIEKSDSIMNSKISELSSIVQLDTLKEEIDEIKISWRKKREELKETLKFYRIKIEKRIELEKFISERISDLNNFSDEKNTRIVNLINESKFEQSLNFLNESINNFNEFFLKQNEAFIEFTNVLNSEIPDFPQFINDIKLDWNKIIQDEQIKWNNIVSKLRQKIHSKRESARVDELDLKLKENSEDIEGLMENLKKIGLELIKNKDLTSAEKLTNDMYIKINQKIKTYDQDFKNFIKSSINEFKAIRDPAKDLAEKWEIEKKKLTKNLNKIKIEMEGMISKSGSAEKKAELRELIKTQTYNVENKINQLELNYNQLIKSGKNLSDFESKLETDIFQIRTSLKSSDNQIKSFIKTATRIYDYFNDLIVEEVDFWNNSKLLIEKKLELDSKKIEEDIFIQKVQFTANAFKGKTINTNYLSKLTKIKLEPLKLKLITLISNSKLIGQLDPDSDNFILKKERTPEEFSVEKIKPIKEEKIEVELDPIKQDILSLRYLIIIHNGVGASIFNRKFGNWQMDSDLIGGFLTAIQDFSSEIKQKNIPITRMEYKDFEIILEQGNLILTALFIDGKESDWLREKLKLFVEEFEKENEEDLKNWKGELASFRNAGFTVDKTFELYRV